MTLIAGVKCSDGFLVAADTALTSGDSVHHGEKLDVYLDTQIPRRYRIVIAGAGHMSYARMASQRIRDEVAGLSTLTIKTIKSAVVATIVDMYSVHIHPFLGNVSPEDAPNFSLIVGIQAADEFELLATHETTVDEVRAYRFDGSGANLAYYLGETLLRSRGNSVLSLSTACAVHVIAEIFGTVKRYGSAVGLDTQIVAWRRWWDSDQFYSPMRDSSPSAMAAIQENLKYAYWAALEGTPASEGRFLSTVEQMKGLLVAIRNHAEKRNENQARLVRYNLMPATGEWGVVNLDPMRPD